MILTVDRFEGEYAILEDGQGGSVAVYASEMPAGTAEGSKLVLEDGKYSLDASATDEQRHRMFLLQQELMKKIKLLRDVMKMEMTW